MRTAFLLVSILLAFFCKSNAQLPEDLTSTRALVLVSVPNAKINGFTARGDWKKQASIAHQSFRKIGIDPILYLNLEDLHSGPEISTLYKKAIGNRGVSNVLELLITGSNFDQTFTLRIFHDKASLETSLATYEISASSMDELMLVLGRQVLRQEIPRTNFLIVDHPEYLDDIKLYTGTRFPSNPSRLKSLKLAVVEEKEIEIPSDISEVERKRLEYKNKKIVQRNLLMEEAMNAYPFKWEFVSTPSLKELSKAGFQYVLYSITSSGQTVRKLLNYEGNSAESVYISEIKSKDGKTDLKRIPASATMTKYYIKQTIADDLHIGRRWDAAADWQQALQNFITNLKSDFNL